MIRTALNYIFNIVSNWISNLVWYAAWNVFFTMGPVLSAYILGDFLVGFFHWIKDSYFAPHTPFVGREFVWNSRLHHLKPRHVIEFTDWELIKSSGKWVCLWMVPVMYVLNFNVFSVMLFGTLLLNDVIHKYAHMMDHERPYWATLLQKSYLIQSYGEHHLHHLPPHDNNYCPVTPFVNVVLEKVNFWRRLERFIETKFSIKARNYKDNFVEDDNYPAGIKFIPSFPAIAPTEN